MMAATHISAHDFHTPVELAHYHLAASSAGRVGGLRFELVNDGDGTRLGSCYQQVPLRLLPPFRFSAHDPVLAFLLNSTAGLLDGDGQLVEVTARAGSRALVVGQSATRIHPALHGFTTQQWRIRVEENALLVVLPGPAIPFHGCRYYQRVDVELAENAAFIWGDIWLAGRYARGEISERFRFDRLVQELTVRRAGQLALRERFVWEGPWNEQAAQWHFGGHNACASLFISGLLGNDTDAWQADAGAWARFPTNAGDTLIRGQGSSDEVTAGVVELALKAASVRLGGKPDADWIRRGHLAPNHWFVGVKS